MNTEHNTIQDAVAEIAMLSQEGFSSFKCYKQHGFWRVVAK